MADCNVLITQALYRIEMRYYSKYDILKYFTMIVFGIIVLRLFYIQIINNSYKLSSANNALRYEVQYPPRGVVFDRNGEYLIQSKETYDLMVVPGDVREFDTTLMCRIINITPEKFKRELRKATNYSRRKPSVLVAQITKEAKLRLDEMNYAGFYVILRTARSYPRNIAGNLLGYVGEVNDNDIARDSYYRSGDYIGKSGIELAYENELRGVKGVKITLVDVNGVVKGSYKNGMYDTVPQAGHALTSTLDGKLQQFGEELMAGKIGSIVAIEPSTGEILVMASSPTYNPDQLVGRERGDNYMALLNDPRHPLFNRAVMAKYPPGSTFKLVNGLIGLQEGVLQPSYRYPCHMGYTIGRGVKCHNHPSPLNLEGAVQMSCNAYFCYVFRNIIDNTKYKTRDAALEKWAEYVRSFGYGRKLDSDFIGELDGYVPNSAFYDKRYSGHWNSLTVVSLSIGQGELGCTPLQMANLASIVANRGYYYIPHVVKKIEGRDSIDSRFYIRHYTEISPKYFDPIVEGMYKAVHEPGGTARALGCVPGLEMCGKTGTAQNPHGRDHSTFLGFAPRNNPKIAISVYVENGGFGGTIAVPIASLIMEKYLTDTITRPQILDYVKNMKIYYPSYDKH